MKEPNFAPVYCALYPEIAKIAREHGYCLAIHGSLARDMDLICVPWVDHPSDPQVVVDAITKKFAVRQVGEPEEKKHGRIAYTVSVAFGECALDLSFMPRINTWQTTLYRETAIRSVWKRLLKLTSALFKRLQWKQPPPN